MGGHGKLRGPPGDPVDLSIEALGPDAAGRATGPRGRRFRVPGALFGECVRGEVVFASRRGLSVVHPRVVDVASPDRVFAPCPHAVPCGGCDLLHARLSFQHAFKRRAIAEALGLPLERVDPVVSSPRTYGYRAFAKFVVGPGGVLGSYRPRGHVVQDMVGCRVHAPQVEAIADDARSWLEREPVAGALRYVLVRVSLAEKRAVLVIVRGRSQGAVAERLAAHLAARADVAQVFLHTNDSDGDALMGEGPLDAVYDDGPVFEHLGPVRQLLSPRGFVQVNPEAAAELYRRAVTALNPAGRTVLDLYAGSAGVSLSLLAAGAKRVVAVERDAQAAAAARVAAETAAEGGGRLTVIQGDVGDVLRRGTGALGYASIDDVVLNPPRKGAGPDVMAALSRLSFERLLYVSCNPSSLARDLADRPFAVEEVTPVDLFPHTRHIETLLVARRKVAL